MRAVVTGASSMIASSLIRLLVSNGHEVFAFVRPCSEKLDNLIKSDSVHIIEAELSDMLSAKSKIGCDCDVLFHFAWSGTGGAMRSNAEIQQKNVQYTLDAVELAKQLNCKTFVGAGSQAEYGRAVGKLTPDTPCNPENEYGRAKFEAGEKSRELAKNYGIKHIWLRVLSVYGVGDNDFTITVSSLKKLLNGKTAEFTPAEQLWDFLYCDDAANAFYLAALKGKNGAVYTLGSGEAKPLKDYIEIMRKNAGGEIKLGALPYNENQVMYLCADISELTADTGFKPQIGYEEGIRRTINWLKEVKSNG
ncbi:MAG: NAD(P)-dependent oxidoreductase [Clostridia bacterium]|nr:NAD(P)-dependent oxidoreductase [Clostridia bacterium]